MPLHVSGIIRPSSGGQLCIKLELIKELYYDARPNKSQESYTETDFFLSTKVIPCQHHSASTRIVFIYQRRCDMKCGSTAARLLGLWIRIPPGAWICVSCECCVLPSRGLCVGPITRSEESYRAWCIILAINCVVKQNISPCSNQDYRFIYKSLNNASQIKCLKT